MDELIKYKIKWKNNPASATDFGVVHVSDD